MEEKDFVCIVCPRGCHLHIDKELNVTGNNCPRGIAYARQEATNPTRIVTSTVRIDGAELPLCPVKTSGPIPKGKIFDIMSSINVIRIKAPVHIGDVVISNVANTGIDIVACRDMEKVR